MYTCYCDHRIFNANENPSHTYPAQGSYTVSLTAGNPQCEDILTMELIGGTTGNVVIHDVLPFIISPNPGNGLFLNRSADFRGRVFLLTQVTWDLSRPQPKRLK